MRFNPTHINRVTIFNQESLQELADSIRQLGLIQPLIVQRLSASEQPAAFVQLITGERRWRAASWQACLKFLSSSGCFSQEMLELALVENIQRADLNPLEERRSLSSWLTSLE